MYKRTLSMGAVAIRRSYIETFRKRSELAITDTELKLIAAAAIMGLSRMPKKG